MFTAVAAVAVANGKEGGEKEVGKGGKGKDAEEGEGLRRRGSRRVEEEEEEEDDDDEEEKLISRQVDDIRLTLALLHSNVDKFIANKIMTVYAGKVDFDKTDARAEKQREEEEEEEEEKEKKRCKTGFMKCVFRSMRPTLPKTKWERI